jgi:hypothetical protein
VRPVLCRDWSAESGKKNKSPAIFKLMLKLSFCHCQCRYCCCHSLYLSLRVSSDACIITLNIPAVCLNYLVCLLSDSPNQRTVDTQTTNKSIYLGHHVPFRLPAPAPADLAARREGAQLSGARLSKVFNVSQQRAVDLQIHQVCLSSAIPASHIIRQSFW